MRKNSFFSKHCKKCITKIIKKNSEILSFFSTELTHTQAKTPYTSFILFPNFNKKVQPLKHNRNLQFFANSLRQSLLSSFNPTYFQQKFSWHHSTNIAFVSTWHPHHHQRQHGTLHHLYTTSTKTSQFYLH